MRNLIMKFDEFIKESVDLTETDIREYIKQEIANFKDDLLLSLNNKYPLEEFDISTDIKQINELYDKIIDIYTKNVISNIKEFDKFWDNEEIKVGDKFFYKSVLHHADKIENGMIYDKDRDVLVPIEKAKKQKDKQ